MEKFSVTLPWYRYSYSKRKVTVLLLLSLCRPTCDTMVFTHCDAKVNIRPIAHWQWIRIRWQAFAPSVSAGRAIDVCYQHMHLHNSKTHAAVQSAQLFHIWQSLKTPEQIIKMTSYGKSSDEDDHLVLLCFWCKRRMVWSWIALECCPCWDWPFLMFLSEAGAAHPCSCSDWSTPGIRHQK